MSQVVQAGFERRQVFTKLKDHDVMFHGQVYALLKTILSGQARPVRLLDIGCGDCLDFSRAAAGTALMEYTGIDTSEEALEEARNNLSTLPCNVRLIHGDYTRILDFPPASFDIVWMGLFLHHLPHVAKEEFLVKAFALIAPEGFLLAHDPLLSAGEDRAQYMARLEAHGRKNWTFLDEEELAIVGRHWSRHGHQESQSSICEMGKAGGFADVVQVWSDPDDFYGVLCFQKT